MRDAYGEGAYCPKFCQNIFQHVVTSKPPLTQFRQNVCKVLLPLHSSIEVFEKLLYITIRHVYIFKSQL